MAWSTPLTAVSNTALNASQWNASVRDNLAETAAAKATTSGRYFVATGTNTIAERTTDSATVNSSETTTSTNYTNITTNGPVCTGLTTGTKAIVHIASRTSNSNSSAISLASFEVTGSTTDVSTDTRAVYSQSTANDDIRAGVTTVVALTGGTNTFRMQYKVNGNTGTFSRRHIVVMPL